MIHRVLRFQPRSELRTVALAVTCGFLFYHDYAAEYSRLSVALVGDNEFNEPRSPFANTDIGLVHDSCREAVTIGA